MFCLLLAFVVLCGWFVFLVFVGLCSLFEVVRQFVVVYCAYLFVVARCLSCVVV